MASRGVSFIYGPFKGTNDIEVECVYLNIFKKNLLKGLDLEATSMYTFKGIRYYWMNEKTVVKHHKLCATVEPILLAFPSLYIWV